MVSLYCFDKCFLVNGIIDSIYKKERIYTKCTDKDNALMVNSPIFEL